MYHLSIEFSIYVQATRQPYFACVSPIADYGIQLWWGKTKDTLLKEYQTIEDAALRHTVSWVPFKVHLPKLWRSRHLFSPSNLEQRSSASSTRYGCYLFLRAILLGKRYSNVQSLAIAASPLHTVATPFYSGDQYRFPVPALWLILAHGRLESRLPNRR